MASMAARVVLALVLACCMMVYTNAQGSGCCDQSSSTSLSYSQGQNNGGTPTIYGYATAYYQGSCGSCVAASYNLNSLDKCKFVGTLPAITSYTCDYPLTSLPEYSSKKLSRKNLPCQYNSDSSTPINDTHVEQCYTNYLGIASATYDLGSPTAKAKITCTKLSVTSKNCYTNRV